MADHEHHDDSKHGGHGGHGGGHGPPHGGGGHEEHEGAPEWLISFADNVMLIMGFFVILLAMNMKPAESGGSGTEGPEPENPPVSPDIIDAAIAIRAAFNNPVEAESADPADAILVARLLARQKAGEADDPGADGSHSTVQTIRPGDFHSQGGVVPFEHGATTLSDEGRARALDVVKRLKGLRSIVEVRGHCSTAEAYSLPKRGMDLAFDRAQSVADLLVESGLSWEQIRLIAAGDNEHVSGREYTEFNQRENRRVEIVATGEAPRRDP